MPHLSPQTLTHGEQKALLRATARNLRDHLIYSLALGTGLRLAEIVGLNVGDVYIPDGRPKNRVRLRPEIAKNCRADDVLLPVALVAKLRRLWRHKDTRRGLPVHHTIRMWMFSDSRRERNPLISSFPRFPRYRAPRITAAPMVRSLQQARQAVPTASPNS